MLLDEGTELQRAIRMGDAPAVRAIVKRGDDLNTADFYGYLAIHYVAVSGVTEVARIILNVPGVYLDKRTPFHQTALFLAALHNHYNVFSLLLESGANPNAEIMLGQTVLHWIVRQGNLRYISELIKYGADVNFLDCFGMSPLRIHLQATMDLRITRLLMTSGADINETRFESTSILKIALFRWRQDRHENFRYLIRHGADVDAQNYIGETALHWAARASAPEIIKLLVIKYNADITARTMFGHSPLDVARKYGNNHTIETIRYLEEQEMEKQMELLGI